jgi:hypothetical protein
MPGIRSGRSARYSIRKASDVRRILFTEAQQRGEAGVDAVDV